MPTASDRETLSDRSIERHVCGLLGCIGHTGMYGALFAGSRSGWTVVEVDAQNEASRRWRQIGSAVPAATAAASAAVDLVAIAPIGQSASATIASATASIESAAAQVEATHPSLLGDASELDLEDWQNEDDDTDDSSNLSTFSVR